MLFCCSSLTFVIKKILLEASITAGQGKSEMGMKQLEFSSSFLLLKLDLEILLSRTSLGPGELSKKSQMFKIFLNTLEVHIAGKP